MTDVCFVSCVKGKRDHAAPAKDLYRSTYFTESKTYAMRRFPRWYILSARHGLVEPDQVIAPYELTLNTMPVGERRQWADRVLADILARTAPTDALTFLTGTRYHELLVGPLRERGYTVHLPMQGLRFGEKLRWLQQQNAEGLQ